MVMTKPAERNKFKIAQFKQRETRRVQRRQRDPSALLGTQVLVYYTYQYRSVRTFPFVT